jgi:hypothetical protein
MRRLRTFARLDLRQPNHSGPPRQALRERRPHESIALPSLNQDQRIAQAASHLIQNGRELARLLVAWPGLGRQAQRLRTALDRDALQADRTN